MQANFGKAKRNSSNKNYTIYKAAPWISEAVQFLSVFSGREAEIETEYTLISDGEQEIQVWKCWETNFRRSY